MPKPRTGDPIVTGFPATRSPTVEMSVASVGPYPLSMVRPGCQRLTSSAETASPPTPRTRSSSSPSGSIDVNIAGVISAWVTSRSIMNRDNSSPPIMEGGVTTRVAAAESADIISPTDMSKLGEVLCRNRERESTR